MYHPLIVVGLIYPVELAQLKAALHVQTAVGDVWCKGHTAHVHGVLLITYGCDF